NNIIADPKKFPSGIKAFADYVHSKGLKLGIYSNAAQLTCGGFTGSLNFEDQDAKTFATWGVDYLKYDYCGAPADSATAVERYKKMGDAVRKTGRDIALAICEWGDRKPWHWAANSGGQLWRTTADVRDKWKSIKPVSYPKDLHGAGAGILDILDINSALHQYAGPGRWNDADMLVVGLYGKKGPSGDLGGIGCTDVEYQSQMSLWSMMASPLAATNDIRKMNSETKRILTNEEIIAINQDELGKQAERIINNEDWTVLLKPLSNGDYAVAILNRSDKIKNYTMNWSKLGLTDQYVFRDVWRQQLIGKGRRWKGRVLSHETKVFRLKKV
ncbi:MAG TPA: glycoside hydrolase family 27 protein, partial [Daejeonella sp.]|nr:glycoside hydrolase family 27 protein [Daejeonella sp.]